MRGNGYVERERGRGCRSRVDTRIYSDCRWYSLHLILVGEIDDIILHNSGLPKRPERTASRGEGRREGARFATCTRYFVTPVERAGEQRFARGTIRATAPRERINLEWLLLPYVGRSNDLISMTCDDFMKTSVWFDCIYMNQTHHVYVRLVQVT